MTTPDNTPAIDEAFAAPSADLANDSNNKPILKMKYFSAWWVFLLSIVTFGIYPLIWAYSRANEINFLSKLKKANLTAVYAYIIIFVASIAVEIIGYEANSSLALVSVAISILSFIAYVVVAFSIKAAVTEVINEGYAEPISLSGVLTFFFSSIYLQYKINEAIELQRD